MPSRYEHLSHDELVRLLYARDRRDATRFGLVWETNEIERDQAVNGDFVALDLDPALSTPAPDGGWRNLIIEGDNFDALRHLRMTHAGQVKCIYIDPPYNTGNRDVFDPRELRRALLKKLQRVMAEEAMAEADDPEQVARFLDVILSTHPEALWEAQKKALAAHAEIQEAEDLPAEIVSAEPLTASPRNAYGVLPPGINGWEREFAEMLDRDPHNLVLWWHRNPPDKPWAVNVLMPDGRGFYPDFVVGIDGRNTEDHALLADPKERFETSREAPKVLAEHRDYGRVLIVAKDSGRWMTIGYDERSSKAIPAGEFRIADTPGFGIPSPQSGLAPGKVLVNRPA